jgi:formyltetrahydrofolate deformylase
MSYPSNTARLLISCQDRPGIVAAVSQFLYTHGANILESQQHSSDPTGGRFFMRMVFFLEDLDITRTQFERAFQEVVASKFEMEWRVSYADQKKRMAIMVSKYDHCLLELLWRWRSEELRVDIPFVLSNHEELRSTVEGLGLAYHFVPITKETKEEQEAKTLELLRGQVDFIVLARYMQILSSEFIRHYPSQIINIHHSFLPAFVGAHPYKHAYERGVKLIGATGHYVTEELDQGPIIEQDVRRVSHRDSVQDLIAVGREIERAVLARAVAAHVEDRVIAFENKTIVFE